MSEITYVGEHLVIGNLGKFFVYLAFFASVVSLAAYMHESRDGDGFWKRIARGGFWLHSAAVIGVFVTLFIIIQRHYFEYHYAWQHSSRALPLKYMISCFWEGQEGSFLLWITWHVILGNILLWSAKSWEPKVMAVMAGAQVMLTSMLLGITLYGYKLGSNPFTLLRDAMDAPIFQRADYLSFITDGNGLNPLLQNYWMVIHPPTLFLGFAAVIVPFAYAIAALWQKDFKGWIKPALSWGLFAMAVLGTGIIMGGFWAYESLSFGGWWAWDPVENASLVPWLILVAAVHGMLIYKHSGNALKLTLWLTIAAFVLILYSTFLTRSGILGNSSVHSFTDLGMSGQLLVFLMAFLILSVVMMIWRNKDIPVNRQKDNIHAREFWMFIGALIFIISAFQIILSTSVAVINKISELLPWVDEGKLAPPANPIDHYNRWQLPIAIIIALLTAISQYFHYRGSAARNPAKILLQTLVLSAAISLGLIFLFQLWPVSGGNALVYLPFYFMLLTATYAIVGNAVYIFKGLKGKLKIAGASVAHVGFGLLLIGALVSGVNKRVISINRDNIGYGSAFDAKTTRENILLWKNKPKQMEGYLLTYLGDSISEPNHYYKVRYQRMNAGGGFDESEDFILKPNAQINPKMGLIANPDTRHYFTHDVFTHVTSVPDKEATLKESYGNAKREQIRIGDTIKSNNGLVILERINPNADKAALGFADADLLVQAQLHIDNFRDTFTHFVYYAIKGTSLYAAESEHLQTGLKFRLLNIYPNPEFPAETRFEFEYSERPPLDEYIIMKAILFPWINLLWAGTIIMVIGIFMAMIRRMAEKGEKQKKPDNKPEPVVADNIETL